MLFDFDKNAGNFIHELLHCFGLSHNLWYITTENKLKRERNGCDYQLPQSPATKWNFGDTVHPNPDPNGYLPNNIMFKDEGDNPNYGPTRHSITNCQMQKIIWNVWNYSNHPDNSLSNLNQCLTFFQPCNNTSNAELEGSHVLSYDFTAFGNIIIKNGASLTVTCELKMPQNAKIIVEPGGKLIVDGGTIWNSCGSFWGGIEVRSNTVNSQFYSSGAVNYQDHGFVHVKNGSQIRNAEVGIYRKTQVSGTNSHKGGGIVKVENSNFINNQFGIYMEPFEGTRPGTYQKLKDLSYITNTDFYTTGTYPSSSRPPLHQIFLLGTNGVDITSCEFNDNATITNGRHVGITSVNSSAKIFNNEFNDLKEAVRLVNTYKKPAIRVEENDFNNCQTGTFSQNADNSLIVNNDFNNCGMGSIIQSSVGFKHTENTYITSNSSLLSIGVGTRDLSAASNRVYKNNSEDLDIGVFSSGKTPFSNQGLKYKCNEFEPNTIGWYDILVNSGAIDKAQGKCNDNAPNATVYPSGNALSHTCGNLYDDIQIVDLQLSKIVYSHHFESTPGTYTPQCYDAVDVSAKCCLASFSATESCPSENVFTGSKAVFSANQQTYRTAYYNNKDGYNSSTTTYLNMLDAGNTTVLKAQIDSVIGVGDSVNEFLQGTSSLVSDEVLNYCINHSIGLYGADLYNVLEAYSPLSPTLAVTLSSLHPQLSSTQITELEGMQDGLSPRDEIELEIRWYEQQTELALNEMLSLFLYDSSLDTLNQAEDSMLVYLQDWNSNWAKEQQVKLHWQLEEFTTAQLVIDDLGSQTNYQNTVTLLQMMHDAFANDTDITALLTDTVLIDNIALDTNKMGYALAQGLLMELIGKVYPTIFKYEDNVWSRSAAYETNTETNHTASFIKVYPNPSQGKFIIEGLPAMFIEQETLSISVFDNLGKQVFEKQFQSAAQIEVELPHGLSGLFFLRIEDKEGAVFTKNLLIHE